MVGDCRRDSVKEKTMSVTNEAYAAVVERNSVLEAKLAEAQAALRLAHDALFNDSGDGDIHVNAVRAIDAALIDPHN